MNRKLYGLPAPSGQHQGRTVSGRRFVFAGVSAIAATFAFGTGTASAMTVCGSANGWSVGVSDLASCGFAFNVARGVNPNYFRSGAQLPITAYSPATGLSYTAICRDARQQSGYGVAYECSIATVVGGVVFLWQ
jgi:hypothetical protein